MTLGSLFLASSLALFFSPDVSSAPSPAPLQEQTSPASAQPHEENLPSEGVSEAQTAQRGDFKSLSLVVLGEEQGELASVDCRDPSGGGNTYDLASQVTFLKSLKEAHLSRGAPDPIVLSMGDTIFPGAFAKYLSSQGDEGLQNLAEIIHQVPFDLMSAGNHDLSQETEKTLSYFSSARKLGMPYLLANLTCEDAHNPLCMGWDGKSGTKPYRMVSRNGLQIGLTSLIDPTIQDQIAKDRLTGVKIGDPKEALKALAAQMRLDGADVVVALFHQGQGRSSSELVKLLEGVEGLDVLITDKLFPGEDGAANDGTAGYAKMGQIIVHGGKSRVMASTSAKDMATVIHLTVQQKQGAKAGEKPVHQVLLAEPQSIETREFEPDAQMKALLLSHSQQMCASWGKPLSQSAKLSEDFGLEQTAQFVLNTMRFTTRTEVAFMNTGAFREVDETPLKGTLSEVDLHSTLPFDSKIVTAKVLGSDLEKMCGFLGKGLSAAGVEKTKKGELIVNGRPLNKKRKYTVAMNEFVAEGSGGFVQPKQLLDAQTWRDEDEEEVAQGETGDTSEDEMHGTGAKMLSDVLLESVESHQFAQKNQDGTFTLSPDKGFPNLYHSMLWHLGGYLNASYGHMVIKNPNQAEGYDGDYDKSRLTATATDHLDVDFKIMANGSTRNHGWDNDFVIQYATTREKGPEEDNIFEEDKDVVRLRSAYKYLGQRANMDDAWYAPVPFVEGQVETELTKPSDSPNHPLDLTGILGLLLKLHDKLEYKIGVNVKGDALEPHGQVTVGLFTGYRLLKADLLDFNDRTLLQFESEAEYFYNVQGKNHIHEFRWENRLFLKITTHFSLTGSLNMYLYKTSEVGELGRAIEGKIGLSMELEQMFQSF